MGSIYVGQLNEREFAHVRARSKEWRSYHLAGAMLGLAKVKVLRREAQKMTLEQLDNLLLELQADLRQIRDDLRWFRKRDEDKQKGLQDVVEQAAQRMGRPKPKS